MGLARAAELAVAEREAECQRLRALRDELVQVVAVVRDLPLPEVDARLRPLDADRKAAAEALAEQWALGSSMARITDALERDGA